MAEKRTYLELSEEWQRVTPGLFLWKSVYNWAYRKGLKWTPTNGAEMHLYGDFLKIG